MQVIVGPRGSGKTTELVMLANERDAHIVVSTYDRKKLLNKSFDVKNEVFTFNDLSNGRTRGLTDVRLMIDDVEELLSHFVYFPVEAITITGESRCL